MREKVKRFEEAADSAEERVQLARREANVRSTTFASCSVRNPSGLMMERMSLWSLPLVEPVA